MDANKGSYFKFKNFKKINFFEPFKRRFVMLHCIFDPTPIDISFKFI
jgi:hypothetical protein